MAEQEIPDDEEATARRKRRPVRNFLLLCLIAFLAALALAWMQRKEIADDFIADTLRGYGVDAQYEIVSIEPGKQVLRNILVGDPDRPDLTIERVEIHIAPRLGLPGISRLVVDRPRLWGRIVEGEPSFGALDPLVFTGSEGPFEFPDMRLTVHDGRALVEGDHGPVAVRLHGGGHLRGGFVAELAAIGPQFPVGSCKANDATLFGEVGVDAERPWFSGPLRFEALDCGEVSFGKGAAEIEVRADRNLSDFVGEGDLRVEDVRASAGQLASIAGSGRFTYRGGNLTSDFSIQGRDMQSGVVRLATFEAEGGYRAREQFAQMEIDAAIQGNNLHPGRDIEEGLASATQASAASLLGPLLERLNLQLTRETRGSTLAANLTVRREEDRFSLVVPEARVRGNSGSSLLMLSRLQIALGPEGLPLVSGNFSTGGQGLPQINGRMEQDEGSPLELRMRMREYAAGDAMLALPELNIRQSRSGSLTLDGRAVASGAIPGGHTRDLAMPIAGSVTSDGAVAMWNSCTEAQFDELLVSSLRLDQQALTLCPPEDGAILAYDGKGLSIDVQGTDIDLAGSLGESPVQVSASELKLAYPGALSLSGIDVFLGQQGEQSRLALGDLWASLEDDIHGTLSNVRAGLFAVPLDVASSDANWHYADGMLEISDAKLQVSDRQMDMRFDPLVANGATLRMADGVIVASAALREPRSQRLVAEVDIQHALESGLGHADLSVPGLLFDDQLQVAADDCASRTEDRPWPTGRRTPGITCMMQGVVALVNGTVFGSGRIDWNPDEVTSSGSITSESLDLAAAFGPVEGASGTIEFTDLINLTTLPAQRVYVRSINPGIEVFDGELEVSLSDGAIVHLESARWPFLGGTLTLRPVRLAIGVEERRSYILEIEGLQAQRFIEHMEMYNLAATGVFDGTIPIIFDEQGNGSLEGGLLRSRSGGSLSYIGDLSYEDLSPIANYAFAALRALEYNEMRIDMNGSLIGELVTQVSFEGARQGEGAQQNIVTKRLSKLPIRFVVNIRAPFYSLMTSLRSLYDPTMIRDPRGLGLMRDDGARFLLDDSRPGAPPLDEPDIQPPESEEMP